MMKVINFINKYENNIIMEKGIEELNKHSVKKVKTKTTKLCKKQAELSC